MRVLVIEDEETLARLIESRLKRENYEVAVALEGDAGLLEALRGIYDLIILDVMLPGTSGFDILSELKQRRIPSRVIMLTARGALEDKLHGLKAGADDYVTKPFHLEELAARVNVQLRQQGQTDGLPVIWSLPISPIFLSAAQPASPSNCPPGNWESWNICFLIHSRFFPETRSWTGYGDWTAM